MRKSFTLAVIWTCFAVMSVNPGIAQIPDPLPEGVVAILNQASEQPDDFAVACQLINNPDRVISYNADERFPLASVAKLLIFIEFAIRADNGQISRSEQVSVAVLESYNLPGTDRGAHDRFMSRYTPGTVTIPIGELATDGMMQYSSNAAADFLLDRMLPIDWERLYGLLGVQMTDQPHALTAIPLMMNNHLDGMATMQSVPDVSLAQGKSYLRSYLFTATWRAAEIAHRTTQTTGSSRGQGGGSSRNWPEWDVQAAVLQQHTAIGTATDFLAVLNSIYGTKPGLSARVRTIVREALRWNNNSYINDNYVEFGSKLGFYSGGTLTLIAYGEPLNGQPVISATFLRNIPREVYFDLVREDAIGDFAHWLNFTGCRDLNDLLPE
jgi:hypothetical protein